MAQISRRIPMRLDDLPEDTIVADGWDDALIGYGWRLNTPIAVYDRDKTLEIMRLRDGMTEEDAEEYFSFNVEGAYFGEGTPLFITFGRDERVLCPNKDCLLREKGVWGHPVSAHRSWGIPVWTS